MPPDGPSGIPASRASATLGRTPSPSTTRSAGSCRPDAVWTARARPSASVAISVTASPSTQLDAEPAHGVGDERADVGVEHADRGGRAVDDRHRQPAHLAGLGHLQADVAAADDHHPAHVVGERRPQRRPVVEGLHAVDAGRVDARHRRPRGHAARGVDEVVERLGVLACRPRGRGRARVRRVQVDPDHLGAGAHVDVVAPVRLRRPRDELLLALDGAADPVRDAARRVGGGAPPLERDDLQLVGPPPLARLARRAHARRVAADDHQPVHGTNLRCCGDLRTLHQPARRRTRRRRGGRAGARRAPPQRGERGRARRSRRDLARVRRRPGRPGGAAARRGQGLLGGRVVRPRGEDHHGLRRPHPHDARGPRPRLQRPRLQQAHRVRRPRPRRRRGPGRGRAGRRLRRRRRPRRSSTGTPGSAWPRATTPPSAGRCCAAWRRPSTTC